MNSNNRPRSIVWFERFFIASLVLSLIDLIYHLDLFTENLADDPEFGIGLLFILIGAGALGVGLQMLLWYFIAIRASAIARILYIFLWAFGIIGAVMTFKEYMPSEIAFLIVNQLLMLASIVMLFRVDAVLWVESKGQILNDIDDDLKDVFR